MGRFRKGFLFSIQFYIMKHKNHSVYARLLATSITDFTYHILLLQGHVFMTGCLIYIIPCIGKAFTSPGHSWRYATLKTPTLLFELYYLWITKCGWWKIQSDDSKRLHYVQTKILIHKTFLITLQIFSSLISSLY